jgi:hypothetical protein
MRQNLLDTQGLPPEMKKLEAVFRHNVFRRFLDKENIINGAFYATRNIRKD